MISDTERLGQFIRKAKDRGISDDSLVSLLRQNGWSERRIYAGLTEYYESTLGEPIPSRGSRIEQARDAFLYLLAFITLGWWTVALVMLSDQLIDHAFPSALDTGYAYFSFRSETAGLLAALILAFPLFLFVSRLITREASARPEALESGVRKWLTYIALVITAVTLLGDAIVFLSKFLSGDLSVRFALKAVVLLIVASGIFWYYLGTVGQEPATPLRNRIFAWLASAAVVIALAMGFAVIGTPARERALSLDNQRVTRLAAITNAINQLWAQSKGAKFTLPRDLHEIKARGNDINDPGTGQIYEYIPGNGTSYKLCATFDAVGTFSDGNSPWNHPAGHQCFTSDAKVGANYYGPYVSQ
jgi:hypothetical protein